MAEVEEIIEKFLGGEEVDMESLIKYMLVKEYKEGKIPADKMISYLLMMKVIKG